MRISQELYDQLCELATSIHIDGREYPNPIPVEAPLGVDRPPTLKEQIQRCMKIELSQQAAAQDMETLEESMDFDIPGDDLPPSRYEVMEDEIPSSLYKQLGPEAHEEASTPPVDGNKVENQPSPSEENVSGS